MSIVYHVYFSVLQYVVRSRVPHKGRCVVLPTGALHIGRGAQQDHNQYDLTYQHLGEGKGDLTAECATQS